MTPPLIALEEHWYSSAVINSFDNAMKEGIKKWPGALERLLDAGDLRLQEMNKGKVSLQVISHCAADRPSPTVCREGNDQLAAEISKSAQAKVRFAGFAVLPMENPEAAAVELERAVKQLGFVGALIDNKASNQFYDGKEYDCFWAKAQELDTPIYLHPSWPSDELMKQSYAGNYSPRAMGVIGGASWGWHSEVGLHLLRLHAAGIFDRHPKLKIVLGHFGEMVPFMLQRIIDQERIRGVGERPFAQVWDENVWITTSGCWGLDPMRCILSNTKIDRILFSIDYPFTTNEEGLRWIENLEQSGLVTLEQLDRIAYRNAEELLGVKAPTL